MKYIKLIGMLMITAFSIQAQGPLKGIIQKDFSELEKENNFNSTAEKWGLNTSVDFTNDDCNKSGIIDLAFLVDATSSMDDQIDFLKAEIKKTILDVQKNNDIQFRTSSVFYRDVEEEYQVKSSRFSKNLNQTIDFIDQQRAAGGGDYPEEFALGFQEAVNLNWSKKADAKLLFVFCDAPPHENEKSIATIQSAYEVAAANGITIFPVLGTAADFNTEVIMKTLASKSNGAVVSLQDESSSGFEQADFLVDIVQGVLKDYADLEDCDPEVESDSKVFVYGNTQDDFSKEQLIGTNLVVTKNDVFHSGSSSDVDGFYSLELEPGIYNFRFSYTGFQDQKIKGVVVGSENELKVNGDLKSGIDMKMVIVTEKKKWLIDQECSCCGGFARPSTKKSIQNTANTFKEYTTSLSPNPANTYVNIIADQPFKAIKIFSSDGKLVFQQDNIRDIRTEVQVSNWAAGMYLIYYFFEDGMEIEKLVLGRE